MMHGGETMHQTPFVFRKHRVTVPRQERTKRRRIPVLLSALALLLCFLAFASRFLSDLATQIAVSDAADLVSAAVNRVIARVLSQEEFASRGFVRFEKNEAGEIAAVSADMGAINALSAEILENVVGSSENRLLTVSIPAGNLSGVSLLMGRGPAVPVEILMLTSSRVGFDNSIISAGINQTKHRILLSVCVDIDVVVPWGTRSTQVQSQVLIADTIVVGKVPETFVSFEDSGP